ncbi:hypothetical protein Avbf_10932, partial [Armadillidium vulgare]
ESAAVARVTTSWNYIFMVRIMTKKCDNMLPMLWIAEQTNRHYVTRLTSNVMFGIVPNVWIVGSSNSTLHIKLGIIENFSKHECRGYSFAFRGKISTRRELKELVCRISNVLKDAGVNKGDRVAIYLPVMPFAVATMFACTRIGAIHSVVFAGFSAEALASRITDAQAETVITADQAVRGGKTIELKKTVDEAVSRCPSVKRVFVTSRTGAKVKKTSKDIDIDKAVVNASPNCPASSQNAEDLLFILYTSGSTGKPKGIAHSTAGYLLYASVTHKVRPI